MLQQESGSKTENVCDPSINSHRPASEITQDISDLLASIFKDLYTNDVIGKDTAGSLAKSRRGGDSYHDRYVEELQQAHSEYRRRLADADKLEMHIVQARAQAAVKEERARINMVDTGVGEACRHVDLPPVKSSFRWCVDGGLLKKHSLISPEDYLPERVWLVTAPRGKRMPGFTNPTISYNRHICSLPQDDGYSLVPPVDEVAQSMLGFEETLTLASTRESGALFRCTASKKPYQLPRPPQAAALSDSRWSQEKAALLKLKERLNFLRNPGFLPPDTHHGGRSLILPGKMVQNELAGTVVRVEDSSPESIPVFLANPPIVIFADYRVGQVYETTLELRNLTASCRRLRLIPPTTPHFTVGLGKFPGEGGIIAPGMSCQYTVRFAPDSLADFEDFLVVETQAPHPLIVPIEARRHPPILSLPRVLDCGYCLVGGIRILGFLCRNEGLSEGAFCIMPKRLWPASNLRSVVIASFTEQPPFGVSPSLFQLLPGQATTLEVAFFPSAPESFSEVFSIVCDNCQVRDITIQGTGEIVAVQLVSVTDREEKASERSERSERSDPTTPHSVRFDSANPHSLQQKRIIIRNNVHLELPFYWEFIQPELPHRTADCAFDIVPGDGVLAAHHHHQFLLSYCPRELKDYHSICHLVLRDIPVPPGEPTGKGLPQHWKRAPNSKEVVVMEIELKGSTEPLKVLLEPYAMHFPGEIFVGTAIRKRFKMWNNSKSNIQFQWERVSDCHIMVVEPSIGQIEANECCDLELGITGGRPGLFASSLQCHIQHHSQPITLAIQATFKGPKLSTGEPCVDLGLVRLGDQARSIVHITNSTPLEAPWALQECLGHCGEAQVTVRPCRGLLPPLASCSVDLLFRPTFCQHLETILELTVENGTACHLSVQAEVQTPQVCLLSCTLVFSELYVGVPAKRAATLFNQTLLPATFSWGELQGKHATLCSVSFSPSTGILGPNAQQEVMVEFTAHTDIELTEVAAICEVEGMEEPLVLGFFSKAKGLRVSYSLPTDCPKAQDQEFSSLVLDFGSDVVLRRPISKHLAITNHTAIPSPFTVEAEFFTGLAPAAPPAEGAKTRHRSYFRRPLHSVQAEKEKVKAQQEFVNRLLSHGRGAAFLSQPASGVLGPFETQTVCITALSNMWGEYSDHLICKVRGLEPVSIPMKISVRGCPLYFSVIGQQLDSQTQGPIIRFGSHVSGGDTVSRTLCLNNASPYDIRLDWETFNLEREDRQLLDLVVSYGEAFPLKDSDGNQFLGLGLPPRWERDRAPSPAETSSSLTSEHTLAEPDEGVIEEEGGNSYHMRKLVTIHVRPHEGITSDYPYCITPQQMVVPAAGSSIIHVSFTPLTLSEPTSDLNCMGIALGFMSLDCKVASCIPGKVKRAQGFEVEPLRLDMQASVKPAFLSLEMDEEEAALELCAVASDLLQSEETRELLRESIVTQSFQLKNTVEMALLFKLKVQAPFSILLSQSHGRTGSSHGHHEESQLMVLQPRHTMKVNVAFHNSPALLTLGVPGAEVPPTVQLITSAGGEKRLQFKQDILVEYSNSSVQSVPLCAYLCLPTLHLSGASVDFGTCYVDQTHIKEVFLYNQGVSSSYWTATIEAEEGGTPFSVSPNRGTLKPSESRISSSRQPLQISFRPRDQAEVRVTVTVRGILGEQPVSLQVRGRGSLDEKFVSLLA